MKVYVSWLLRPEMNFSCSIHSFWGWIWIWAIHCTVFEPKVEPGLTLQVLKLKMTFGCPLYIFRGGRLTRCSVKFSGVAIRIFDVHVTVHRDKFLIVKPSRCTNFSNLFLEWNSTCFGHFLCPSSGVFTVHTAMVCQTCLLTACEQDQDGTPWSSIHSKNKFEKLVHLVGFIIRNLFVYCHAVLCCV